MSDIDHRIFRAYDIRGRAHEQLTEHACFMIGQAFGSVLRESTGKDAPRVCVGRDARTHGPELEEATIEGLKAAGCHVLTIGQTPSPVNYFTICTEELDGGIHVTASHNPPHDNGLKLSTRDAEAFAGEDLQELRKRIAEERLLHGEGTVEAFEALQPYLFYLSSLFPAVGRDLKVVVDSGNGVAGPLYCDVLRAVGANVTELYTEPDGRFPNHAADPSKLETLKDLQAIVTEQTLDIGLAFDGDGDRLGLINEKGGVCTADEILMILAQDHLSRFPGAPVVFTVSNSGVLNSSIEAWGGKPVLCKVGHSFVEHAMREYGSKLGGEQSGHFFCGEDYFGFDDALVAALRVLSIVKQSGKTISELCSAFPRMYQAPERRPHVPDDHKGRIIDAITTHFSKDHDVITLDGARINFHDGSWIGIRQSNTSPCISICMEAPSPERLQELETMILEHLKRYPEIGWNE